MGTRCKAQRCPFATEENARKIKFLMKCRLCRANPVCDPDVYDSEHKWFHDENGKGICPGAGYCEAEECVQLRMKLSKKKRDADALKRDADALKHALEEKRKQPLTHDAFIDSDAWRHRYIQPAAPARTMVRTEDDQLSYHDQLLAHKSRNWPLRTARNDVMRTRGQLDSKLIEILLGALSQLTEKQPHETESGWSIESQRTIIRVHNEFDNLLNLHNRRRFLQRLMRDPAFVRSIKSRFD